MKPRLLDLFCGAGGCAAGYQRAGFYVVGVDIAPQPNYCGDEFVQADALTYPLEGFSVVHASPPCQLYSVSTVMHDKSKYPDHLPTIRARLIASGLPYVIENVPGAPMRNPVMLCGSGFNMTRLRRHRLFESNVALWGMPCVHGQNNDIISVVGHSDGDGKTGPGYLMSDRCAAMGIDWMTSVEMSQAIPPAYTKFIGHQLMEALRASS